MNNPSASSYQLVSTRHPYRFSLTGNYQEKEIVLVNECCTRFFDVIGPDLGRKLIISGMLIKVEVNKGNNFRLPYQICFDPRGLTEWTVTHELSHALDGSMNWQLSARMRKETHSGFWMKALHKLHPSWKLFWYRVGSPPPPCGIDKKFNALEDFAESLTAFIFPEKAAQKAAKNGFHYEKYGYTHFHKTPRGQYIQRIIDENKFKTPSI